MTTALIEPPKYLTLRTCYLPAQYNAGVEVVFEGWPQPHELRPLNSTAKRIASYRAKYGSSPMFPKSLHDPIAGGRYLPATLPSWGSMLPNLSSASQLPNPVDASEATDDMPQYELTGYSERRVGNVTLQVGSVFAFLAWPLDWMVPTNEAGALVKDYYEEHGMHYQLSASPYCLLREGLVLPTLPALPARPKSQLDAAFYQDCITSEIAVATGRWIDRVPKATAPAKAPKSWNDFAGSE